VGEQYDGAGDEGRCLLYELVWPANDYGYVLAITEVSAGRLTESGSEKHIITMPSIGRNRSKSRFDLVSDPMALHHDSENTCHIGLRNSSVLLKDYRTPGAPKRTISKPGGKAVVGVRRLNDAAVPWGLVVSSMAHEVSG
jgi:hypothetical protein